METNGRMEKSLLGLGSSQVGRTFTASGWVRKGEVF